jgi:hypothetical protein
MDFSPRYIGQRRFNGHYGRRHWHVVDSWSQEHSSLSGDDPCARGHACVVTADNGEKRFTQRTSGASVKVMTVPPKNSSLRYGTDGNPRSG